MSETDLKFEDCVIRLHDKLNQDQVKLWLEPYHHQDPNNEIRHNAFKELVVKYSGELAIDHEMCLDVLFKLQNSALTKLQEREQFRETGTATIHVKVSGNQTSANSLSILSRLTESVYNLKGQIAEKIEMPQWRIKLIFKGAVLSDNNDLLSCNVKNGSQIMAVILHGNPTEIPEVEKRQRFLEDAKADVQMLAGRSDASPGGAYLEITDQTGQKLKLPAEERNALVTAMALHEKGRAALKKEDYALALVLLLEADHEFSVCNSRLLQSVDNYAVLNLDIAWCYLCLQNVTQLPEADARLKKCEENFNRSYGPNLERLIALKGTAGKEAALFLRLHLLQGIVLYHQNKRDTAKELLKRAEKELNGLKIDDASLSFLLELGYSPAEARLGLRGGHGDVNLALDLINRKREERKEAKRKEAEEREAKKHGICANGKDYVVPGYVKQLKDMGYSEMLAVHSLQETNNSISDAIQYMQEHPEMNHLTSKTDFISQVSSLGLSEKAIEAVFTKHNGNFQKAFNDLMQKGLKLDPSKLKGFSQPSTAGASGLNLEQEKEKLLKEKEKRVKENEAVKRIAEELTEEEEDHLDLELVPEEQFLKRYLALLE